MAIVKTNKTLTVLFLCLILGLIISPNASAQFASGSSSPINITADNVSYAGDKSILTGGVDVRQGNVRVLSDTMEVFTAGGGSLGQGDISKIIAIGNFYYLTPDQSVRGKQGIYTRRDDTFVVTGNVIMKQADGSVITGEKLFYNLGSQNARVVGTCKGRKCGAKGRVNILIKNAQNVASSNS